MKKVKPKIWSSLKEVQRQKNLYAQRFIRGIENRMEAQPSTLVRIAVALEQMSLNWITLVRDRDNFQKANQDYQMERKRLDIYIDKLNKTIVRLKKKGKKK